MSKPKYLSRFTYNSAVDVVDDVGNLHQGTVRAVKFSESAVHYDVMVTGQLIKDIPSMRVFERSEASKEYTAYVEVSA